MKTLENYKPNKKHKGKENMFAPNWERVDEQKQISKTKSAPTSL